ncbi:MAG: hypothetical protein HN855_15740 [Anaerolineae bacterium]|jgi:hypothetical protein|nr:hypothetical protein [Anaerolineae bacterium]MBT7072038.1 hypothetical protein [Anaerolineae bacterium]MBT7326608.1 hypothetical protein [Anaerolineae bacterium]
MSQSTQDEDNLGKKLQNILSAPAQAPPAEEKSDNDIFSNIPKRVEVPKEETTESKPESAPAFQKKKEKKGGHPSGKRSRWENSLRALWTLASAISMIVNVVVIAFLIGLYQNYTILNIPEEITADTPKDLLQGLYDNFELMDEAHIITTIPVESEIPVQFTLGLNQETTVILSEDVTIDGARVALTTGGLNIFNAPATVTLPAGTNLPIILNLEVPVDEMIPVTLTVPVDIALSETGLHIPFLGLQEVLKPLYCLVSPSAKTLNGEDICPQEVSQ